MYNLLYSIYMHTSLNYPVKYVRERFAYRRWQHLIIEAPQLTSSSVPSPSPSSSSILPRGLMNSKLLIAMIPILISLSYLHHHQLHPMIPPPSQRRATEKIKNSKMALLSAIPRSRGTSCKTWLRQTRRVLIMSVYRFYCVIFLFVINQFIYTTG